MEIVTQSFSPNPFTELTNPWSRVLVEKLTGFQLRNAQHFMAPEGLLQHSQEPATSPYPKPDQSSPCPQTFLKSLNNSYTAALCFHLFR